MDEARVMRPTDVAALLDGLEAHDVPFVVVGSAAAAAHGVTGFTPADLDIVPSIDPHDLARLDVLLDELGARVTPEFGEWRIDEAGEREWVRDGIRREIAPRDPARAATFDHSYETRLGRLDIVPEVAGGYAVLRSRARRRALDGRRPWVAHPVDVLAGMTRPRRAKDGPRVRQLRELILAEISPTGPVPS